MFFLTSFNIWSFSFFFSFTYIILFMSFIIYLLPLSLNNNNFFFTFKHKNNFYILSSLECIYLFISPILIFFLLNLTTSFSLITAWFGHLLFSSFQSKFFYFITFIYILCLIVFLTINYFSSNEIYDFLISKFNMYYWVVILFFSNTLFTVIFVIEVLSTLVFLLITTSLFSTSFFYKNINFDSKIFFQSTTPFTFLQSLLFYFWVSLISSLNLFVFLTFFFNKVLTFDWFLLENIFYFIVSTSSLREILLIGFVWFVIIFSIFLKCGIAPLFLWKPTFFKGLNFNMLFFYITFFYFFLFLFFINFLSIYFNCIFYYYSIVTVLFTSLGLVTLFFILCETFYLKIFFAISSILNSLLLLVALLVTHNNDFLFFL